MSKLPINSKGRTLLERRDFLKGSGAVFGTLIADRDVGALKARLTDSPGETAQSGLTSAKLVEVPAADYEATDPLTAVPVTIVVRSFLIAPFEVTQREFEEIMGYNPSFHKGPDLPVETVNWWEAIRYCNLRSVRENLEPCYDLESGSCDRRMTGYRLPTDAEWAHAAGPLPPLPSHKIHEGGQVKPASPSTSSPRVPLSAHNVANLGGVDTKSVDHLFHELATSGTRPAGTYPPNQYGLYDMYGNVWEWCNDYFDPVPTPVRSFDPPGPERGLQRIIRGGSFMSSISHWATDWQAKLPIYYRSSMDAGYKSRFTGFRVCRTAGSKAVFPVSQRSSDWFKPYNNPPAGYESSIGNLSSLVTGINSVSEWEQRRKTILAKWLKLLGSMETTSPVPKVRFIETVRDQHYSGRIMQLQTEPDVWAKIMVLMPNGRLTRPCPTIIVPFYDVDDPVGRDLSGCTFFDSRVTASTHLPTQRALNTWDASVIHPRVVAFAHLAVQRGCIAVAVRWWQADYGECDVESVANLKLKHPHCTGLGKWMWDTHRVVDYLHTLPEVDHRHIGIIGHSLGGKMALYAGAFDKRIAAVVASEPGIGLSFSNYNDYWYFGDFIEKVGKGTDQHELLGLTAPRPFLLIGGDVYDTDKSWYYINAAREVYKLYGKPLNIGYYIHSKHKQHNPTPEADRLAMEWLTHFLQPGE